MPMKKLVVIFEDKATKELVRLEHDEEVGVISEDDVTGLTLIAEPVGVVCGITPTTNLQQQSLKRDFLEDTEPYCLFAFHHEESSAHAAQIVRDAAIWST